MRLQIRKKLGGDMYIFTIGGKDETAVMFQGGQIGSMPTKCRQCGSENVHLTSNKAKGYEFVKVICEDCNARAQMGQYKSGGIFWKDWEEYKTPEERRQEKEGQEEQGRAEKSNERAAESTPSDYEEDVNAEV